ncbi:hypothetical protein DFH06DRAFT_1336602 [Mycena polygramma]|nr:hypothetical protein DFH06DRAFT_1336602 [Mycena polygramma]
MRIQENPKRFLVDLPDFPHSPHFALPALPLLQSRTIGMLVCDTLDEESFRRLDAVIVTVDAPLRSVNVEMHLIRGVSELLSRMRGTRALMPRSNAKGYLSLTYTHNRETFTIYG